MQRKIVVLDYDIKWKDAFTRIKDRLDDILADVSHGDLLSVFNVMFMGLNIEDINRVEVFGLAGGVSYMFVNDEGKRIIKKISDILGFCKWIKVELLHK